MLRVRMGLHTGEARVRCRSAWTAPITGNFEAALREVSASLEELRRQDEPFWTALAAFTAGAVETALGRSDSALQHLRVMRELADRFDYHGRSGFALV
jgi:hypothetical protein